MPRTKEELKTVSLLIRKMAFQYLYDNDEIISTVILATIRENNFNLTRDEQALCVYNVVSAKICNF